MPFWDRTMCEKLFFIPVLIHPRPSWVKEKYSLKYRLLYSQKGLNLRLKIKTTAVLKRSKLKTT